MKKRLLALSLALLMLVGMLPTAMAKVDPSAIAQSALGDDFTATTHETPAHPTDPAEATPATLSAVSWSATDDSQDYTGPVTAKYIRLYSTTADQYMSAAEVRLVMSEAPAAPTYDNLARLPGVTAADDDHEEGTRANGETYNLNGMQAIDSIKTGAANNNSGHWSTNVGSGTQRTLTVDLHRIATVSSIKLFWKHDAVTAYNIATSADGTTWSTAYTFSGTRVSAAAEGETVTFSAPVSNVRYVRLQASADAGGTAQYANVNLWEIEIYGTAGDLIVDTPSGNLCRPTTCDPADTTTIVDTDSSSHETDNVTADKLIDGGFTNSDANSANVQRWASTTGNGPHWVKIDLGKVRTIAQVKLYWERGNVKNFKVECATEDTDSAYTTVYEKTDNTPLTVAELVKTISFAQTSARFVKVTVTSHNTVGVKPDGTNSATWNNVSLWEVEVYRDAPVVAPTPSSVLATLTADSFEVADGTLRLKSDVALPEGFTVSFAANLEQVVAADHTVYQPLVDTVVDLDVTVTHGDDSASSPANTPIQVTIPGENTTNTGNPKPAVIPELMEWYGGSGTFTLASSGGKLVYDSSLSAVAKELKADLEDLFGVEYTLAASGTAGAGDIELKLGSGASVAGFDDETYLMAVTDKVVITAKHATGVYWGTRTALQALKLSGDARTIPQGTARDYPEFKVRSFILDVGRKPMSLEKLYDIAKNMAWYKMNDFHVHLNDNLIFMEDYGVNTGNYSNPDIYVKANDAYSAFRLESSLKEEADAVAPLSAKDYHYTKAEFKQLTQSAAAIGVTIVPEFDVPAHAKAITDAFPSLRLQTTWADNGHPANCHFDLTNKYDASLAKVQEIFNEYIDAGVFGGTVHFGADEYFGDAVSYRRFMGDMITYLKGKTVNGKAVVPRVWGSLSHFTSNPTQYPISGIDSQGVQINVWNSGWSNPQAMYDLGFDLINCLDGSNYIVPDSGYYHPNGLGTGGYSWDPNNFSGTWLPASSSQMVGGAYAIWNDSIDTRANGNDELDLFRYFFQALPYYACSLWGRGAMTLDDAKASVATLSYAPQTNPTYQPTLAPDTVQVFSYDFADTDDKSGNGNDLTLTNAEVKSDSLILHGGASCASTGLHKLGLGNSLTFTVYKKAGTETQVIFETDHVAAGSDLPYNEYSIKAIPVDGDPTKWKLGFTRELYDFVYEDVELNAEEWVTLTITNDHRDTKLYVNGGETAHVATGYFTSNADSNTPFRGTSFLSGAVIDGIERGSTFALPVARIGSKTNALDGFVKNVYTGAAIQVPSPVESGKYDIAPSLYTATDGNHQGSANAAEAIDGDESSLWHTDWYNDCPADDGWIQIKLDTATEVAGLRYLPRPQGINGIIKTFDVQVSDNGVTWNPVVTNGAFAGTSGWQSVSFDAVNTTYVRLLAKDTMTDSEIRFVSAAEVRLVRPIDLNNSSDGTAVVKLSSDSYPLVDGKAEPDPAPFVLFDGAPLELGKDYTVSYEDNTAAGTATVKITGKGGYVGTLTTTFEIPEPKAVVDISNATVELLEEVYYSPGAACPEPTVTYNGETLVSHLDYTVTYAGNTALGDATATITGKGDYNGTVEKHFTVVRCPITEAEVTGVEASYSATGAAIRPTPVLTLDGATLRNNTDYSVTYGANTDVGTGTVTIRGVGNYTDTKTVTFTITERETIHLDDDLLTTVTLPASSFAYTSGAVTPEPTVRYDGETLTKGTDYTVAYYNNTAPGTGVVVITGIGDYSRSVTLTFTITGTAPSGGGSSGGSSGGSTASATPTTTTTSKTDNATVTTTTNDATGAVSSVATYTDGAKVTSDITATGITTAVVKVPSGVDATTVTIPTKAAPTAGQVAVILHSDGSEEIIKTALMAEDGLLVTLSDSATLQVIDNTKTFVDVPAASWAQEAITFVTSREIFNGTGNNTFSPDSDMSRAMVCTVLANLAGEDTKGGATWYEKAVDWAKDAGVSDGSAPNAIVTREQLAAMLYRYAGSPTVSDEVPRRFRDRGNVSDWAEKAVTWAVENDLIRGRGSLDGLDLAPQATATRAEVAAVFQRYVALIQ